MTAARRLLARLPGRRPKEHRYVLVVTYGRSGSTLVQGLLNTLPRTLVRGENGLYLLDLFRARAALVEIRSRHRKHNPRASHSAFYGLHLVRPRSFVTSARTLVTGHLLGDVPARSVDVLGFKEVRWHRVEPAETEAFLDYLDEVFPGCLYVLNRREPERALDSGFWQRADRDEVLAAIERVTEVQDRLRSTRGDRVLDVAYEDVTSPDRAVSDEQLRRLSTFVHGSCDDALLEALRETLATGHGPFPFGRSRSSDGGR